MKPKSLKKRSLLMRMTFQKDQFGVRLVEEQGKVRKGRSVESARVLGM